MKRWVPNCTLSGIDVVKSEQDEHEIFVRLKYSVQEGNKVSSDSVVVEL